MTALFEAIVIEAYISGAWVDLTADVVTEPAPQWNMGIMSADTLARVGDAEELKFSLNNSISNSGGMFGYYTPGHTNCRAGWEAGVPVRLSFRYDGQTYYKYYGVIAPDGIQTDPDKNGERRVHVTAGGFMAQAERHPLNLMSLQVNLKITDAVPYVLANMPIQPLRAVYGTGVDTFPTLFDALGADTRAVELFQNLAVSEWGYIYTKGDKIGGQTLVVEGRGDRTNQANTEIPKITADSDDLLLESGSYLLLEDGGKLVLDETQPVSFEDMAMDGAKMDWGVGLANRIAGISYPRRTDASATTVLFSLQRRIQIAAGETVTGLRGRYRDPAGGATYISGRDMVTPVSGTDYNAFANEDGTGTNYTANFSVTAVYGTSEVEYTITNNGVSSAWFWVQARGAGVYLYDPARLLFEDAASIAAYGVYPLSLNMVYQDDPLALESVSERVLADGKQPVMTVGDYPMFANRTEADLLAFLSLEPGTRAHFSEVQTGVDANYFIQGYSARILAGKYVVWSPILKEADDTIYWQLDVSALDTETILDT